MAGKKKGLEIVARGPGRGGNEAAAGRRAPAGPNEGSGPPQVPGRWLLGAVVLAIGIAGYILGLGKLRVIPELKSRQ